MKAIFRCVKEWTNGERARKNVTCETSAISDNEIYGCIVLEMAKTIIIVNDSSDYYPTKLFHGQTGFRRVMSRDKFMKIRLLLHLYPQ